MLPPDTHTYVRQKIESQNGCLKKTKQAKFSGKKHFLPPDTHTYIRQKGRSQNGCFKKTKHAKFSKKQIFLISWFALLPYLCVSGDKMFVFRKIWRALFSWNTRLEIRLFVSLPTNWEYWPQMNWLFVHSFQGNVLLYLNAKYWIPGSITVKLNIWLNFNRWLCMIFLMKF